MTRLAFLGTLTKCFENIQNPDNLSKIKNQDEFSMIFDINKKKIMRYENQRQGNGGVILLFSDENIEIGRCTYMIMPSESKLIISFVLVHKEFEGKGMGKLLVEIAILFAIDNGWKIFPHCSYAHSVMKKMPHVENILISH